VPRASRDALHTPVHEKQSELIVRVNSQSPVSKATYFLADSFELDWLLL